MRDGARRRALGLVLVGALVGAACGDPDASPSAGRELGDIVAPGAHPLPLPDTTRTGPESKSPAESQRATEPAEPPATSEAPPTTDAVTPADTAARPPLGTVAVIGDSMSAGLAAPLRAALLTESRDLEWRWWVGFLTPAPTHVWDQLIDDVRPDVVVVFFAPWESKVLKGGGVLDTTDPDWAATYLDHHVEPLVERVRSIGSRLVWVGMPTTRDDHSPASHADLNAVWRDVVERTEGAEWIDGPGLVGGPRGGYLEYDEEISPPVRLINTDGLHLCPPATVRIADEVLNRLDAEFEVDLNDDWRSTDWAADPGAFGPEGCEV